MVLDLSQAQFEEFAIAFDRILRDRFKRALTKGIGHGFLEARAVGLGVSVDAFLNATYSTCDRLGATELDSYLIHACVALETSSTRTLNPDLFDWIDGLLARSTPQIDQRLRLIHKRLAAMARLDADADRLNARILSCQRAVT